MGKAYIEVAPLCAVAVLQWHRPLLLTLVNGPRQFPTYKHIIKRSSYFALGDNIYDAQRYMIDQIEIL